MEWDLWNSPKMGIMSLNCLNEIQFKLVSMGPFVILMSKDGRQKWMIIFLSSISYAYFFISWNIMVSACSRKVVTTNVNKIDVWLP